MRPRLLECDPIKYSCRQTLENDLRILAATSYHKVPKDNGSDLEEMIRKKKDDCKSYFHHRHLHRDIKTDQRKA